MWGSSVLSLTLNESVAWLKHWVWAMHQFEMCGKRKESLIYQQPDIKQVNQKKQKQLMINTMRAVRKIPKTTLPISFTVQGGGITINLFVEDCENSNTV